MSDLKQHKAWAERVFGKGNFRIEERNGEVCIDAWNPEAKCIGSVFKKKPKINFLKTYRGTEKV